MHFYVVMMAIWLGMLSLQAHAQSMPTLPADAQLVAQSPCEDRETKQKGICHGFQSSHGFYLVLTQNGQPKMLRHVPAPGAPYVTLWEAPDFSASL